MASGYAKMESDKVEVMTQSGSSGRSKTGFHVDGTTQFHCSGGGPEGWTEGGGGLGAHVLQKLTQALLHLLSLSHRVTTTARFEWRVFSGSVKFLVSVSVLK